MKVSKNHLFLCIISILILFVSLVIMICDFIIPLNLWTHPILTFIFCVSIGYFLLCFTFGIIKKSVFNLFVSAICVTFALIYPFAHYDFWWIGLVLTVIMWAVIGCVSFVLMGNKTESIALNEEPEYKDYKERSKENLDVVEEKEELPKIKSFK